jgi:hypothetical protein
MSVVRRSWLFGVLASALLLSAATAQAQDANTSPPQVELRAAGQEGILGPRASSLAFYSTAAPDPGSEFAPDSTVSFTCTVDAQRVPCGATYEGCCRTSAPLSEPRADGAGVLAEDRQFGLGPFSGSVPVLKGLASGPHTVTVTATDEDGTGPPASVTVDYDTTPPSAPELTQMPPRRSRIHKPLFRYAATDGVRLLSKRDQPFKAELRRLDPAEVIFHEHSEGGYLGTWVPRCSTLLTCAGRSQAVYEGFQRSFGFGVPEWLPPGRYEFSVLARDAVGNQSPLTRYRFQILPG